ncbi:DUF2726 domain-containing protein [Lignipirellula cremea]|uniref:Topoisomerase DNA binding C4 zinc finger n=1 Tax=Lignipirellula cremea TaxID=2528010 RepID=A0A518DQL0_9BACT|nr:DUF2726 domain-containing protein [Lignipirellula cremea]QDU94109.1 Topoisomerase DNA binding C4 zinc finger [Lignipirellula cremea]
MNESGPQGCLAAILRFFGIRLGGTQTQTDKRLPYRLRDDFLSPAELSFYRILKLAVKDQATITTKVNLADIFFAARSAESQSYRNKIDRKHVDFLLCDPTTMKPRCGIELDDSSHARRDRQERDQFVDAVFAVAGLPLVRFPARASYDANAIAAELARHLDAQPVAAPVPPPPPQSGSPVCPKCDVPMVQRTASKGQNAGKQFWGCQNYPKCREIG